MNKMRVVFGLGRADYWPDSVGAGEKGRKRRAFGERPEVFV